MHSKQALIIKVLHNTYHPGDTGRFFEAFSEEEAQEIKKLEISSTDTFPFLVQPIDRIQFIHPSWLLSILTEMPAEAQQILVGALPAPQRRYLSEQLQISPLEKPLAEPVKAFLLKSFIQRIPGAADVLDTTFLPKSTLSRLIDWKRGEIIELCNYLGLIDLANEIRHVIDKKKLQKVYDCLNPKEQNYLKQAMQQKEKVPTVSLGLDRWSGDCEKLRTVIQSRGLIRLATALSGEHPDIIWQISHILDKGRGLVLVKHVAGQPIRRGTAHTVQQVLTLMKKKGNP